MTKEDQKRYYTANQDFERTIAEATEAHIKREAKASRRPWKKNLSSRYGKFCDIAYHYQSLFDVLNNQAPEYTTAVWGAVKLLLLVSVNDAKLKEGVIQTLGEVGHQLSLMKVIVELQPSSEVVKAVTQVYIDCEAFLLEAIMYYNENRAGFWPGLYSLHQANNDAVAALKAVISPWETRFQKFVERIEKNVSRVNRIAALGRNITLERTLDNTDTLGLGQKSIQQRQSVILQSQITFGETLTAILRAIEEKAEKTNSYQQRMEAFISNLGPDYSNFKLGRLSSP